MEHFLEDGAFFTILKVENSKFKNNSTFFSFLNNVKKKKKKQFIINEQKLIHKKK